MSAVIDQKAYLQKYLGGSSGDKKKKKKSVKKGKGFKIIDDDLDLSKLRPLDGDELDILDQGEDAPQIAGIIDERPEEIRKLEQFKTNSKWRVINQDDGFNSKLQIEEIEKDVVVQEKENEIIFGKMYSDSEDEKKNDSDLSPPRTREPKDIRSEKHKSPPKRERQSDSDASPPRKTGRDKTVISHKDKHNSDINTSSKKRDKSDNDCSPPRRRDIEKCGKDNKAQIKKDYDSDVSPPRKKENSKIKDRIRKPSRWGDRDENEESNLRESPSADESPPRKSKKSRQSSSPHRSTLKTSLSRNRSPNFTHKGNKINYDDNRTTQRKHIEENKRKRNTSSDTQMSLPRKKREYYEGEHKSRSNDKSKSYEKKQSSDSDISPPRKHKHKRHDKSPLRKRYETNHKKSKHDSDSDLSPPRKEYRDKNEKVSRRSDSPPPSNKKMAKTLEGKKAGLQDAKDLRNENETFRKKEDEAFSRMTDEVSGRNAQVVSRKSKRETSEDRQKQREKAEKQKELDEKYKRWGKGLKQLQDQESRMQDFIHEAAKPLARHKNDKDLEGVLKDVERDGDPMLKYIREKKRERGELGLEKPQYKGSFPPNRFNIRPGYRWDGVDRSNGYEKKFFEQQSKRKANEEDAYKWSTEDL